MIKDVLAVLDYSVWAEVSLLIFAGVFVAVSVRTLLTARTTDEARAGLVFEPKAGDHDDA